MMSSYLAVLAIKYCLIADVQDVEGMMSISTEAAEARASLSDEKELLRTFEVSDLVLIALLLLNFNCINNWLDFLLLLSMTTPW